MTSNKAGSSGGAYYWNDVEPSDSNAIFLFSKNSAGAYGDNVGTYASSMSKLTQNQHDLLT